MKKLSIESIKKMIPPETFWFFETLVKDTGHLDGQGCFAAEDIPEGSLICIAGGCVTERRPEIDKKYCYAVNFGPDLYITPQDYSQPGHEWMINHHCTSNVMVFNGTHFFARRDIGSGEELFIDYSVQLAGREDAVLRCRCESKACRKLITGDDYKGELGRKFFKEFCVPIQQLLIMRANRRGE